MKSIILLLLLISNSCFAQVDLNFGLRAYYPFSGNANDASGNNNNPVFNNATLTADRLGNPNSAYHFNGINTYMRVLNSPTLNMADKISISLWVKPTGFYTGQCYNNMMVIKGDGDDLPGRYSSRFSDVYNGCTSNPSTNEERFFDGFGAVATNPIVQLNQWYSVIITNDGTTSKVYVNCELQATFPFSSNFTNIYDLYIGHLNSAQFPYWLNGDLDEIRIYDRALTVDEVNVLGGCTTSNCDNWLLTQAPGQNVTVGNQKVSGNKLTVEANFNCTAFPQSRPDSAEDLVAKYSNTTDINYLLRMDKAAISTTTGNYETALPSSCNALQLNKVYHTAMVYDGTTLSFYRNGYLISSTPATGNLVQNNWLTTIGDYSGNNPTGTNFNGYLNEVRIWNIARTQAEIQSYMNSPLPTPPTQTGLLAYYRFNDLINKQGNAAGDGTLNGGATINNSNPNCTFTPDIGTFVNAGSDSSFCSDIAISTILNGSGNGTYSWSPAIFLNNPNIQNPIATISSTTTFYLTVTGPNLCEAIDSVTIYVNPVAQIQTLVDTAICQSTQLLLTTNSNATTFQWTPAFAVSNAAIASPYYIGTTSQKLYVTCSTGMGCIAIDSIDVTVKPLPIVQTINDTVVCNYQPIILNTTGALSYSWSPPTGLSNPSIANPVFIGNESQTYTVTGTDINGCQANDVVNITISTPTSFKQPPSAITCLSKPVFLNGNNGNNVSYLWSPSLYLSNDTIINPLANPPQTTLYTLIVRDNNCGFDTTFTTLLTVLPSPLINATKSNDIDCVFRSATLTASGGNQYVWSPATGLSNTSIANPVAKPSVTQKYIVQVKNAAGCINTDSVTVIVNTIASLARYMPNAFTPNADGLNDCYGLKNWMYIKQLQFFIFNRYGEQVFATTNPNNCWDGNYKGKPALAGTYVFVIKATTDCGIEEQKGNFLLIR